MRPLPALLAVLLLGGCEPAQVNPHSACTDETVGTALGSDTVTLTLLVPDEYMWGGEISNGGIAVVGPKCEYILNAVFARETAEFLIEQSAEFPLRYRDLGFKLAEAEMSIYKFEDESRERRFFVTSIISVKPAKAPPRWWKPSPFEMRR